MIGTFLNKIHKNDLQICTPIGTTELYIPKNTPREVGDWGSSFQFANILYDFKGFILLTSVQIRAADWTQLAFDIGCYRNKLERLEVLDSICPAAQVKSIDDVMLENKSRVNRFRSSSGPTVVDNLHSLVCFKAMLLKTRFTMALFSTRYSNLMIRQSQL